MLRPICKPARAVIERRARHWRFSLPRMTERGTVRALLARQRVIAMENAMKWETPVLCEVCIGMEVTSYQSADDSESIDSEI
jgi:coenzyme PQQ precursor peptide PqqA